MSLEDPYPACQSFICSFWSFSAPEPLGYAFLGIQCLLGVTSACLGCPLYFYYRSTLLSASATSSSPLRSSLEALFASCAAIPRKQPIFVAARNASNVLVALWSPKRQLSGTASPCLSGGTPALTRAMYRGILWLRHCLHSTSRWPAVSCGA
jgi:hypothetical protein